MIKTAADALIAFSWFMVVPAYALMLAPFSDMTWKVRLFAITFFQGGTVACLYWLFSSYSLSAVWPALTKIRQGTGFMGWLHVGFFFLALASPLITFFVLIAIRRQRRRDQPQTYIYG